MHFKKLMAKNGMPVYIMEMPYVKSAAIGVLVKTGTRDEIWPKEAGLAHALEHMVFRGTEKFPDSQVLAAYIENIGGQVNAWTDNEATFFYVRLPDLEIGKGMDFLSQMLLHPLFNENDIRIEMENVVQEISRSEDNPQSCAIELFQKSIYGEHSLGKQTLGFAETVRSFRPENFRSFMERFYQSGNMALIAAGNIQSEELLALFEEYFPEQGKLVQLRKKEIYPVDFMGKSVVSEKNIQQTHIVIGSATCKYGHADIWPLSLFGKMLSGGMSFPLFQEIRDKRGLAYSLWAGHCPMSDIGNFMLYIGTDPKRYQEAIDASLKVIWESKNSAELLAKAKDLMIGQMALQNEETGKIIYNAARTLALSDEIKTPEKKEELIRSVTIEQIVAVVDKYLNPDRLLKVILAPKANA